MKSLLTTLGFIAALCYSTLAQGPPNPAAIDSCMRSNNVDPAGAMASALNGETAADANMKAFALCALKAMGLMDDAGNLGSLTDFVNGMPDHPAKSGMLNAAEICKGTTGTDASDKAWNVWKCLANNGPKMKS